MVNKAHKTFSLIFNKNFDESKMTDKIKMQKVIYLLSFKGINFGIKNIFSWDTFGPFSYELAKEKSTEISNNNFTDLELNEINYLKNIFDDFTKLEVDQDTTVIAEIFASIHYLYYFEYYRNKFSLKEKLIERKGKEKIESIDFDEIYNCSIKYA